MSSKQCSVLVLSSNSDCVRPTRTSPFGLFELGVDILNAFHVCGCLHTQTNCLVVGLGLSPTNEPPYSLNLFIMEFRLTLDSHSVFQYICCLAHRVDM